MLEVLRQANEFVGRFTPAEIEQLTPREYEYMVNGAQKRQLNQWEHDYAMSFVTHPVGLVGKNDNDTSMRSSLRKIRKALDNFNNVTYQKQEKAKKKRQQEFASFFDRFSRRNTEKKGV